MASFQSLDATVHKNITSTHSSTQLLLSQINPNCTINFFLGTLYRCNGGYILTVVRALHHLWSNKECTNVIVAGWRLRLRLRLRISFAVCLELGHWNFTGRTLIPVSSIAEVQVERGHYLYRVRSLMSARCGWRVSRARHTTCALARHRSECEFYLEHFVVQLYLYVVCILCIYTLVYFLLMSFAHSRPFLQLYLSISVRIVYSFVYFWYFYFIYQYCLI